MKLKFLLFFIISVFCISMTACGSSEAKSVASDGSPESTPAASELSSDEEDSYEIPASVLNLTKEEDILLTGVLDGSTYTNEYFGYSLTAPEGWTLSSLNEPGEDGKLMRFSQTYTDGFFGILIDAESADASDRISVNVYELEEDEIGLSEDELISKNWEFSKKLNEEMETEDLSKVETVQFAGEDHPAIVETFTGDDGKERLSVHCAVPKGDFEYSISFLAVNCPLEELLKCVKPV